MSTHSRYLSIMRHALRRKSRNMPYWDATPTVVTTAQIPESTCPAVIESYRDFEPPPNFRQNVETLLRYVPSQYLIGLKTVVLTNRAGLSRNRRKHDVWSRSRKALGSYYRASKSSPATVCLYTDNIMESGMGWLDRAPVLRYLVVGQVLYHEIGHHIHAVHRPAYAEKEDVAENWSGALTRRFYRQRYWYLYPFLMGLARLALRLRKFT
jgi:hypothetical protein